MSRRDSLERAMASYDEQFERKLVDAPITTIADCSLVDGVMVIRTGEAAAALTTVLAFILALSPASTRSRAAIEQTADSSRRKLLTRVRLAERDADFLDFKARCVHDGDRARGGNA
jgi:hypothetical protein